jgi:hypothetical protein
MTEPKQPAGPPMTLGNMRAQRCPSRLRLFFGPQDKKIFGPQDKKSPS